MSLHVLIAASKPQPAKLPARSVKVLPEPRLP
jgi:hypothetical protein